MFLNSNPAVSQTRYRCKVMKKPTASLPLTAGASMISDIVAPCSQYDYRIRISNAPQHDMGTWSFRPTADI